MTSPRDSPSSPSNKDKRRRTSSLSASTSSSSAPPPPSLAALPPPMISNPAQPPLPPPSPMGVAYYPVYSAHNGQFYIVSPPLHPTSIPSSSSHPTKILPKLSPAFQAPTPPLPPSPAPYPFYHHPYPPPITPPAALKPTYPFTSHTAPAPTTADQREQARKVSHSAIERRRRERINDKIMQLKQLIPTCADQENLHKMSILQSAIDYITYLKEIVEPKEEGLKPKDLFLTKKVTCLTTAPSTTAPTLPTNMSVKNLLC